VFALLPVEGGQQRACQPGLHRGPQLGLAFEPSCERDVGQLHIMATPEWYDTKITSNYNDEFFPD